MVTIAACRPGWHTGDVASPTTDSGGIIDVGGQPVQIFPSRIVGWDAAGNLTEDPSAMVGGEVVETLPDGSERFTSFIAPAV